jgi:hypothetical protein
MRCFQPPPQTRFYAGVDLHARSLFLAVLDRDGQERFARKARRTSLPERRGGRGSNLLIAILQRLGQGRSGRWPQASQGNDHVLA